MSTRRDPRGRFGGAPRDPLISTVLGDNKQETFSMSRMPASRSPSQNVPYLLQGAEGNMIWEDGQTIENATGAAAIGFAAINALDCIAKNEGKVTDRDLGLIKELVNFIQPDTMNSFRKGFRELLQQATPPGGLSNSFLPKDEGTRSQPVKHGLFPKVEAESPRKRSRLWEGLKVEEDTESKSMRDLKEPLVRQATPFNMKLHDLSTPRRLRPRHSTTSIYPSGGYYK
ncbi:hypothetical protein J3E68DRAFT_429138 [Trichoderma sp. SZMC 28012]